MEKLYWTTKSGKKIDVDEMSENHLRNVLKMIIRSSMKPSKSNIEKRFEEDEILQAYYDSDTDQF